jgi:ubiquinone/menaquinone biosynthesis C-methylase UbiE
MKQQQRSRRTENRAGDRAKQLSADVASDLNPQREQMADESMVRTLDAQARAIWPQEVELIRRYGLPPNAQILDAGCGTGEVASRLADLFPEAQVLAVDILDHHLALARQRYAQLASRLRFEHQSIFELAAPSDTFDLAVCRHVLHSVPQADRVLKELARVTKPGGRLHVIPEDYGMLHFQTDRLDLRSFWHESSAAFGVKTKTDLYIGRNTYAILAELGLTDIAVDYVIVDTLRVPRETFAAIFQAWRDGYVDPISEVTRWSRDEVAAFFEQMIADIRDPRRYAVWMVPVVSGRKPL